jgi:hypothetical protein
VTATRGRRRQTTSRERDNQQICPSPGYFGILIPMSKKTRKSAPAFDLENAIPLPEAAKLADVTEVWMRKLVAQGTVRGLKIGKNYLVDRRSAAAYTRTPGMGRPRKNP